MKIKNFQRDLIVSIEKLRIYGLSKEFGAMHWWEYCMGKIRAAETLGAISIEEKIRLEDLIENAERNSGKAYPCKESVGPQMTLWAWMQRMEKE